MREEVLKALLRKASALKEQSKPDATIAVYKEIIRRFDKDDSAVLRQYVALARGWIKELELRTSVK